MLPCYLECCGKAAAFVQRLRLAIKGRYQIVRWLANKLSSKALRYVALRAIGLTGASARRLFAATTLGDKGALPKWLVACEFIDQQGTALCCPSGNWVNRG